MCPHHCPEALYSITCTLRCTCGILVLPQVDFPSLVLSAWIVPKHPMLHWLLKVAAIDFVLFFFCFVCVCHGKPLCDTNILSNVHYVLFL